MAQKNKKVMVNFRIPETLDDEIMRRCDLLGVTKTAYVTSLIQNDLVSKADEAISVAEARARYIAGQKDRELVDRIATIKKQLNEMWDKKRASKTKRSKK